MNKICFFVNKTDECSVLPCGCSKGNGIICNSSVRALYFAVKEQVDVMMKKDILSLKSIYQFLVINDYPIFCTGIITKSNHTGLTLTRFWQDNVLVEFRSHKYGRQIWRTEGGRNRYISEICNRSERLGFYGGYAEEIYGVANPGTVLRQVRQFMSFLMERRFHYDAFIQKLPVYLELISSKDVFFSEAAGAFFMKALDLRHNFDGQGSTAQAFYCGWILTFLMFHALMGNGEGEVILGKLREDRALSLEELGRGYLKSNVPKERGTVYLTGRNTELCAAPLKPGHFFGREKELFELREMLAQGGRYLVSGIGGIGKTELMRQFLKCCEEEGLADCICVIQYEKGLADSVIRAFPEIWGRDRDKNFREALARIRIHTKERLLIVIDNMNRSQEEDPDIDMLCKIPGTIFVTSRYQDLAGFETYQIHTIGKDAGSLIFRDNYQKKLTEKDKKALNDILRENVWCHTLTLRILGCVARTRSWTVQELLERLQKGEMPISLEEREGYAGLKQVYRRMYTISGMKRDMNRLLQVFAALPYESYGIDFAKRYLRGFLDIGKDMAVSLERLWISGWLEKRETGYSMHPFIAECILEKPLDEKELAPFFESIIAAWEGVVGEFKIENIREIRYEWHKDWKNSQRQLVAVTLQVLSVAEKLTGRLEERVLKLLLLAVEIEGIEYGAPKERLGFLVDLWTRCREISADTRIYLIMLLCCYGYKDIKELDTEYSKQMKNPEISGKLKYTCAYELGKRYAQVGKFKRMGELADYLWESNANADTRIEACILKADMALLGKGDFGIYEEWLERGLEIGKRSGREKSKDMEELMCSLCSVYLPMQKFDKAEKLLQEMEDMLSGEKTYFLQWKITFYRGSLEMYRGKNGYGIENLLAAYKIGDSLFRGKEDYYYADSVGELAMACNKAGRHEEAYEYYEKALALYDKLPENNFPKFRILNNMSVMFLDWGKPGEAIKYLTEADPLGKAIGGLSEAESANNFSRAWRMLGNREKELDYLRKAVPVLEQCYGSEHPKVVDAKRRMQSDERAL